MKIVFAFWTGLLAANLTVSPTVWKMSALAFGIAMFTGALDQADKSEHGNWLQIIVACVFSGLAGFIVYAFTRDIIHDPLLLIVEFIFAGLIGAKFVKKLTIDWYKKFDP